MNSNVLQVFGDLLAAQLLIRVAPHKKSAEVLLASASYRVAPPPSGNYLQTISRIFSTSLISDPKPLTLRLVRSR